MALPIFDLDFVLRPHGFEDFVVELVWIFVVEGLEV